MLERISMRVWAALCVALLATPATADVNIFDFAAFGTNVCTIGKNVELKDSADPTSLPSLLIGGNSVVSVKLGGTVGGVRAGGDLVLGKSSGSGDTALAVEGDVVGNADVDVKRDSTINGNLDAGEDIVIGPDSSVLGDATAGGTINLDVSSSIGGTATQSGTPTTFPNVTLPSPSTISPGVSDVGGGNNTTLSLTPGAYAALSVGSSSTVTLESGTYHFKSIEVGQNSTLELNLTTSGSPATIDEIAILVEGEVNFGNALSVVVNGDDTDTERKDYSGGLVLETHGSFHLNQNSQWVGLVIAPFGSITFGKSSEIWGAGWSLDTWVRQGSVIDFQLADRFSGPGVRIPRIDFALYSEKKTTVGKDVEVSFTASVGSNGDVKVKSGGQTGSVRSGGKLFTGIASIIHGSQVGNRRAYIRDGTIVEGNVDGGSDKGRVILGRNTEIIGEVTSSNDILVGEDSTQTCSAGVGETCLERNSEDTAVHPKLDLLEVLLDGVAADISATEIEPAQKIARDGSLNLAPGTYGKVKLGARSTLTLESAGDYYFGSLQTGPDSTVNLDNAGGEIAIFVLRDFKLGTRGTLNVSGTAADIYVEVHNNAKIGKAGQWSGTIYAPYKNVIIGQDVPMVGAAYAGKNVIVKDGASATFDLANRLYLDITK